ncbi:MAG: prohibitin family protein [Patescibacteria group bacterium]|nr:prohibitin family protein [Patescibacteria group bacterium]
MQDKLSKLIPLIFLFFLIMPLFGKNILPIIIIGAVVFAIFKSIKKHTMDNQTININPNIDLGKFKNAGRIIAAAVLLIIILAISIVVIPAGETGVYHLFGKVKEKEFSSGIHLKNPIAKITKMSIRTEEYTMSIVKGEGKIKSADAIRALTEEGLEVDLDITVLYHLDENKASNVFKDLGLNYEEKIIRPGIRSGIREVVANYKARDIYSEKRQEASIKILERLKKDIDTRGIIVEEVLLRNIKLPAKLSNAIQEKLTAEQESQRYEFILQKEEKEAERKRIEAAGQKDAQKIINESLSSNYLNYLYIKELKDREGTIYVPVNPQSGMPMFKGL